MGRLFANELQNLEHTYSFALSCKDTIETISSFVARSTIEPILAIGSGGSFSVASALASLHCMSGLNNIVKSIKPLELYTHASAIPFSSCVLLSANGNNKDALNAHNFIVNNNPKSALIICLNEKSKLKKMSQGAYYAGEKLPSGKDGFLAVNTLFASLVWISKSYGRVLDSPTFSLPRSFGEFDIPIVPDIHDIGKYESIMVLHGGLSAPIAIDIESKFSEVALGNVLLADYRNFAHGRHLWLNKRGHKTLVVALINPEDNSLAHKTLSLIPCEVPIIKMETYSKGATGLLELFLGSLELTKLFSSFMGYDPGKPTVSDAGKKIYHISYSPDIAKVSRKNNTLLNRALIKKVSTPEIRGLYTPHAQNFLEKLCSARFNQIVFDYDLTLKDKNISENLQQQIFDYVNHLLSEGISLSVATGRGKSVRGELQERISRKYWENVQIGYYSGGDIASLENNDAPIVNIKIHPLLREFANKINTYFPNISCDIRPKQITIFFESIENTKIMSVLLELISCSAGLKAFNSGHSMDIIPTEVSKVNMVNKGKHSLCIGDSGQHGGNDYEMLSHEFSLSVNRTSKNFHSCWNLAPLGISNVEATLFYFNCMDIDNGFVKINMAKLEETAL